MYSHSFAGLLECYVNAIPYARGTFTGDLVFAGVFFATFHWLAAPDPAGQQDGIGESSELRGASNASGS